MRAQNSMRPVWMGVSLGIAILSFWPAWSGMTGWLIPGIAFALFVLFAVEPWALTWQLRQRGEELQITDEGVLRKLPRGDHQYVRWNELREVAIVVTQGEDFTPEPYFLLAGTGTSGVLVSPALATRHDLLAHLAKLPGFDHRQIANALAAPVEQKVSLWRAAPIEGEAVVVPLRRIH